MHQVCLLHYVHANAEEIWHYNGNTENISLLCYFVVTIDAHKILQNIRSSSDSNTMHLVGSVKLKFHTS